jgi:hypothetical protein
MDSLVFDTVVGVVFVFTVFAFAVSGVVEALARLFGLRAEFLLRRISSLRDSNTEFKKGWLKVLLDKAEKAQSKFDEAAVAPRPGELDEMMKEVFAGRFGPRSTTSAAQDCQLCGELCQPAKTAPQFAPS